MGSNEDQISKLEAKSGKQEIEIAQLKAGAVKDNKCHQWVKYELWELHN